MNETLPKRDIVLLGAGHTNAHIIRMWRMNPIPETRLTCVSDHLSATYSGMLAGTLAGQYEPEDMTIDLVRLCASCGVRLISAKATGLDLSRNRLLLEDRCAMPFDLLSIGIGSRPSIPENCFDGLSIKPMQTFLRRLVAAIEDQLAADAEDPRFAVVGGGAAGVEIACCLHEFVRKHSPAVHLPKITLIEARTELLLGMPLRTQQLAKNELDRRGIEVKLGKSVIEADSQSGLTLHGGEVLSAEITIWATAASPSPLLRELGLPTDQRGFLLTRDTLQSTGVDEVFAVGDAGTVEGHRYPKAGVYAVRQGPILWENLARKLTKKPLERWTPQSKFLSLIGTGDDRAILTYHGISIHNRWSWRLKDWIDSRFMAKYQQYEPPAMMSASPAPDPLDLAMQCGGCGSKASARVLQDALSRLQQPDYEHVLLGLESPDDIALISNSSEKATAVSTDFFSAFVDEPYLLGRIAAQNALSDLFAKGAKPRAALSIVTLLAGTEHQQASLLEELLAGALREFRAVSVPIVGGHSIVGPKLTVGFTILGNADAAKITRKSTPSPGDALVMTKPLGTGVLLAAHMQAACRSDWWQPLIDAMLGSNSDAALTAEQVGISAATDITGFGLAGHLLEMLAPAKLSCEISLKSLPCLPGAIELLQAGFESTLAPSNRDAAHDCVELADAVDPTAASILYDPQTSGGLLFAVPERERQRLIDELGDQVWVIGTVTDSPHEQTRLRVTP